MLIRAIEIDGVEENVTITRSDIEGGAIASVERHTRRAGKTNQVIAHFKREQSREQRFELAKLVARPICGVDRKGEVAATNSMLHDVMDLIDRVAGF